MHYLTLPFFKEVEQAQSILLAGAGGGFDIFCGLPLYFGLRDQGKQVYLANVSFSPLFSATGRWLSPALSSCFVLRCQQRKAGSISRFS
jgi:hypothetical protein